MAKNEIFRLKCQSIGVKQRAQRGMTFFILTNIFVMAAKKLNLAKKGLNF